MATSAHPGPLAQARRLDIQSSPMTAAEIQQRAIPRSTVVGVVAATTIAQVASVMGIAVFPVIAPRLAAEMGVAPALIGYQISLVYGAATIGSPLGAGTFHDFALCNGDTSVGANVSV